MSVLTVTRSAALPDRTLQFPSTPASFNPHPRLPPPSTGMVPSVGYTEDALSTHPPQMTSVHRHSRTISSALLPADFQAASQHSTSLPQAQPRLSPRAYAHGHSRQSSASTFAAMQRQPTVASYTPSVPRRSTSSRSTGTTAPSSYVALMRKQKATVWCDRSQNIDPRLEAAQRVAKQRAAREVNANATSGRTSTITSSGVVGKIRHGGIPKAPGYSPANMSGAGVPMRLSANEMLGDDEADGRSFGGDNAMMHARSGSGKSSSSSRFRSGYPRPEGKHSGTNTPPGAGMGASDMRTSSKDNIPEIVESEGFEFEAIPKRPESEDSFGDIRELRGPNALQHAMDDAKKNEDLRRRGSVDERTMSMGAGVRLFVANPDLDD